MNDKFFPELTRRLRREGITVGEAGSYLPVLAEGRTVMRIDQGGTILLAPGAMDDPVVGRTYDAVDRITTQVREYTTAMVTAPPLVADGLHDGFCLLSEFNGVLLAGRELKEGHGYEFTTWRRDGTGTGVCNGNYYMNDYDGAKLDFACRARLVQDSRQFTDEQLTELYRCIHETLDGEYPTTWERRTILTGAAEQIELSVNDLDTRVDLSNRRELEAAGQNNGPGWELSP